MADLSEEQVRQLFKAMHEKGSPTNNLATTGRGNSAPPFDGDGFLADFDAMLDKNFEIADGVYKKFGS